jgi:intein/homing endonuclease
MSAQFCTVITITDGDGFKFHGRICDFIDPMIDENKKLLKKLGKKSVVLNMDDIKKDYYIIGVSNDEKTSWKRISEISRHPSKGGIVEVKTRTGRKTTATLSHSFLKRTATGIEPILGSDLKIGMRIPIARIIPEVPNALTSYKQGETTFTLDKEFGWICGIYLADGSISDNNNTRISKVNPKVEELMILFGNKYNMKYSKREYEGEFGPSKDNVLESK